MTTELEVPAPVATEGEKEELFRWLGRRDAFSLMAGRCSAADAECIRKIRDTKLYLKYADDWEAFCPKYLQMSKSNANRLLRLLDEFGPAYFYIAQVARINAKEYRKYIAPAVSEGGLQVDGETIAFTPENNVKLAQAVANLRPKVELCDLPAEPEPARPVAEQVASHLELMRGELTQLRHLRYRHGQPHSGLTDAVQKLLREVGELLVAVR